MKVNLTVNGELMEVSSSLLGSRIFVDKTMKISNISKELVGSYFYHLRWEEQTNTSISVSCDEDCAVILAIWEHEDRQDRMSRLLQSTDWISKKEQTLQWKDTVKYPWYISTTTGKAKYIFSKTIRANQFLSFNKSENDLPISVFIAKGNVKITVKYKLR